MSRSSTVLFKVLGLLLLAVLVWGVAIEPRLIDEVHETAAIPGLPPAWRDQRLAVIADLQVGMWLANVDTIRRIVARLTEARPAAVLIAGDFLYEPTEEAGEPKEARDELEAEEQMRLVVELLRPLVEAAIPTYAVLGNHDYAMQWPSSLKLTAIADRLRESLDRSGVNVLHNQAARLPPPGERDHDDAVLYVVGIGPHFANEDRPAAAFESVPAEAPRVVLMHNARSFAEIEAGRAPLAVAAHTHGGQIRLPGFPNWTFMELVKARDVHADGWIPDFGEPGNHLYVSRGIGFSHV